jgi:hypothetical protein
MPRFREFLLLLALLYGGLAHASLPFDDAPRASDEELDRMRGGFVINWNGQEFLLPFSIDGIERLTQINGDTYINGMLVSPRVNPQALTPFTQLGQISVTVPTPAPPVPADMNAGSSETVVEATPPLEQTASGSDANSSTSLPAAQAAQSSATEATSPVSSTASTQVTMQGQLIVIQNGAANPIALPTIASLDSLATIIQNSVSDQTIRNITTMNITIEVQMLAAQARLNGILNQALQGLR